ncbi:hypothetical protein ACFE04_026765 [Oxalis oulophora]
MVKKIKLHQKLSSIMLGTKLSLNEQQVMEEVLDPKECDVQSGEDECLDHKKVVWVPKPNAEKKAVDSVVDSELDLELVETREEVCLEIEEIVNNSVDSLIVPEEESVVKMAENCLISIVPSSRLPVLGLCFGEVRDKFESGGKKGIMGMNMNKKMPLSQLVIDEDERKLSGIRREALVADVYSNFLWNLPPVVSESIDLLWRKYIPVEGGDSLTKDVTRYPQMDEIMRIFVRNSRTKQIIVTKRRPANLRLDSLFSKTIRSRFHGTLGRQGS